MSSNEAEYMALSDASRDALWLRNLLDDLNLFPNNPPTIPYFLDNQGAKSMAEAELTTKRSKHIDIRYHYARAKLHDGVISIQTC